MTTANEVAQTCAICGTKSKLWIHMSSNSCDTELDGSPVGMARESSFGQPQRCPECGHCSPNIEVFSEGVSDLMASQSYQDALNAEGVPELVGRCLCSAMVTDLAGYSGDSFALRRMAAWACDDAGLGADARACREAALATVDDVLQQGRVIARDHVEQLIVIADLLRRVGRFGEAADISESLLSELREDPDDKRLAVAEFQAALIVAEDGAAHTYGEAGEDYRFPTIFLK